MVPLSSRGSTPWRRQSAPVGKARDLVVCSALSHCGAEGERPGRKMKMERPRRTLCGRHLSICGNESPHLIVFLRYVSFIPKAKWARESF